MAAEDHKLTVLLAGATGYIGAAVAGELVRRGHRVVAPVRRENAVEWLPPACEPVLVDLSRPETVPAALGTLRADAILSCLASRSGVPEDAWHVDHGANAGLLSLADDIGARQFILLSAICVQKPRLAFQRAKLAFESELRDSGLGWTIVRPTAYFKSLAGQIERVRAGKPFLIFDDGRLTACKPISEADLATYLCDCLGAPDRRNALLPIGGPGPALTPREQGEMLFRLLGREPRYRSVPPALLGTMAGVLGALGTFHSGAAAKAELVRIGRYYATESMLLWNAEQDRYDASATPEFGNDTLEAFYRRVLDEGLAGQELGKAKLFR